MTGSKIVYTGPEESSFRILNQYALSAITGCNGLQRPKFSLHLKKYVTRSREMGLVASFQPFLKV